ncbi:MAG: penicillin-binding protein 2 [Rhodobacteraceae bacterium TMED111]|nr:penicillin-binding protein 2 [Marinovum sp.]OUV45251.1 MAG: penicillin-binding protein 2 [Rhodobacteraceae bacterium TMED111]
MADRIQLNPKSNAQLSRRGLIIGGLQTAFIAALAVKMRKLQVEDASEYRLLADENRINIRLIAPSRGEIYDRNGKVIARNEQSFRITIVKEDAGDIEQTLYSLSNLTKISQNDAKRVIEEIERSAPFLPVTVRDQLSFKEIARIATNSPTLPGVSVEEGLSRVYPLIETYAHVVGYVGPVSDNDLKDGNESNPLLKIPRFQVGKVGIERQFEGTLRGSAGIMKVEVNALGRVMRNLDRKEGKPGKNIQLTVDTELQAYIQARLGSESASAVVMNCKNGEILAIASSPSYDPNKFVKGISYSDFDELRDNELRPLASKTVQDAYPPGSTFKIVTALAALKANIISPKENFSCDGKMEISNRLFHCWKKGGHGEMDLEKSLSESCDVYFYELALKVGIERISEMANELGLGIQHDIPMSAITKGLVPSREWKLKNREQDWLVGDTVNASIGQGYVLSSPLQLAVMAARIASGKNVKPSLTKSINGQNVHDGKKIEDLKVDKAHLKIIWKALFQASNDRRGTAYGSRVINNKYRMAGKTGTSQVRNITDAERENGVTKNEDLPWQKRDHALFINFAPYDDPEIAVSVVVEHGGAGSKSAAPIARDITLQALFKGTPPLGVYPAKDRTAIFEQQKKLREILKGLEMNRKNKA